MPGCRVHFGHVCGRCVDRGWGGAPGLAACSRIWGVYAPDVGTPLCVAAWLIFITAHNDGAREWGLGWKRQGETKGRRVAKEEWVVGVGGCTK